MPLRPARSLRWPTVMSPSFRTQLRGHHQVLSALRETQLEQGQKIEEQGREMREGFSTLATGMAQITALLTIAESESDGS